MGCVAFQLRVKYFLQNGAFSEALAVGERVGLGSRQADDQLDDAEEVAGADSGIEQHVGDPESHEVELRGEEAFALHFAEGVLLLRGQGPVNEAAFAGVLVAGLAASLPARAALGALGMGRVAVVRVCHGVRVAGGWG